VSFFSFNERQEGLGPPPPPFRLGDSKRRGGGQPWIVLTGVLLFILIVGGAVKEFYTEWLWFDSVDFTQVFAVTLVSRIGLFAGGALGFFLFFVLNLWLARTIAGSAGGRPAALSEEARTARRMITLLTFAAGLFLAFIFGSVISGQWTNLLLYANAQAFGIKDPILGEDVGFYIFSLPIFRLAQTWLMSMFIVTLVAALAVYGLSLSLQERPGIARGIRAHVSLLGVAIFLCLAFGYWLGRYEVLLSAGRVVFGAGYTDVNAVLPVLTLLAALATVSAVLLVINIFMRGIQLPALGVAAWALVALVGGGVFPEIVQRFQVEPNELARERPFIENNILFTRAAYGLDRVEEVPFPGKDEPTIDEVRGSPETIRNVRLWDHDPLRVTYNQIQAIRRYYEFPDIDIDRYTINDVYRQVTLGARELDPEKLPLAGEPLTWVNQRLKYTHGYGVALNPVNEVTREGLPNLFVKNLPPVSDPPMPILNITRPEIYFGEKTKDWVIVNTDEEELDYASERETKYTRYEGKGGVILGSFFRRALFAWQMSDPNILLTGLRENSSILYRRNIQERVAHIAPFLRLDRDPYVVIFKGRLVYMQDAYTTSNRYPYATPYQRSMNYIRNSVKAVVDAYDGTVDFYIADSTDPIIQAYARIFPGVFKPMSEMPAELRTHIRYPEDLFTAQSDMYQIYHMQDPQVFYNKEDAYARPKEIYLDREKPMDAYYVIMRLQGESKPEFVLMLPFTPANKDNANAWLAGRSDGENYGKLIAYKFPKERLIYGPRQLESRIDQDPTISAQFSLWNQGGSRVLRGNLLFVPIGESYMYVEPIYLQAQQSQLPELARVVVAAGNRIAMEPTLDEAMTKVFGVRVTPGPAPTQPGAPQPTPPPPTTPSPTTPAPGQQPQPAEMQALTTQAQQSYARAQERLRSGDWAGYGEELKKLEDILKRMVELANPQQR